MQFFELYGFLLEWPLIYSIVAVLLAALVLAYNRAPLWLWSIVILALLGGWGASVALFIVAAAILALFNIPLLRRLLITAPIVKLLKALNFMPVISETEQTAIEAGNIWVDGMLFSGRPDFKKIMREPYPELNEEEQRFLDGPVNELCRMVSEWDVYQRRDLPPEAWDYIKKERFWGLIIPKEYGGLGFSASANSAIVARVASRSNPLATTVMVPNSLGPAELLLHYGTEEQKKHYLPRLARGEEIPCFALTEPQAGSDAGAMTSTGVVFKGDDGKLYLRLNWRKRYITLAAISTILGLAFKMRDPDNLLGKGEELGITCALIPTDTKGVVVDKRHDPLGIPFYNSPTEGHDVVVGLDAIIGGPEQAGNGWRMLMESLAVGRGISLPATGSGGTWWATRVAGAYAMVRRQFGLPIAKFEGIEEQLGKLAIASYTLDAARRFTCGGLDSGQKPAVITAMAKYSFTETLRTSINRAMDILGGAGIVLGPRNLMAHAYFSVPVNITVEGANILTRTLMIFGQGAVRCHPYAYDEIMALMKDDVKAFDKVFWKHAGHIISLAARSLLLSLSRGRLFFSHPGGPLAPYYRKLGWAAASFAFLADFAMARHGGALKRLEKINGRFADIFSNLYLATTILRRYEAEGRPKETRDLARASLQSCFADMQLAFDALYRNIGFPFNTLPLLWSRINPIGSGPKDALNKKAAEFITTPGEWRNQLTQGIYLPTESDDTLAQLERAFELVIRADDIMKKVYKAAAKGEIRRAEAEEMIKQALEKNIISGDEAELMERAEKARAEAVAVDAFGLDEYFEKSVYKNKAPGAELVD